MLNLGEIFSVVELDQTHQLKLESLVTSHEEQLRTED